jgi:hypothetical protein
VGVAVAEIIEKCQFFFAGQQMEQRNGKKTAKFEVRGATVSSRCRVE